MGGIITILKTGPVSPLPCLLLLQLPVQPACWGSRDLVVALLDKRDASFEGPTGSPWRRVLAKCPTNITCIHLATNRFGSTSNWETVLRRNSQPKCSFDCQLVSDPGEAHGLLFHIFDVPSRRRLRCMHAARLPGQVWTLYNLEPPIHVSTSQCYRTCDYPYLVRSAVAFVKEMALPSYLLRVYPDTTEEAGFFNWTMTYRRDSTFYAPYASFGKLPESRTNPTVSPAQLVFRKRHLSFAVVSNCNPHNRRPEILRELESLMELHVYGRCGSRPMTPDMTISELSEQYNFYLSFENSFCKDYITEKFFNNGLNGHAVPVVFGGMSKQDYELVAPPQSYLYAGDFPSAAALARSLRQLADSPAAYSRYQAWKASYAEVHLDHSSEANLFCSLCRRLKSEVGRVTTLDLNRFFNTGSECRPPSFDPFGKP